MSSKKIAIDVVLLPPEEIMDLCIKINRKAVQKGLAHFVLGEKDYLPHVSLAMGCIERRKLKKVQQIVQQTVSSFWATKLQLTEIFLVVSSSGQKLFILRIGKNQALQRLHEMLMKSLQPWFTEYTHPDALFTKKGEKKVGDLDYVRAFGEKYAFEHFEPHITLWCAEAGPMKLPHSFIASTVAIGHLGCSTTCRKILFSTELKKE